MLCLVKISQGVGDWAEFSKSGISIKNNSYEYMTSGLGKYDITHIRYSWGNSFTGEWELSKDLYFTADSHVRLFTNKNLMTPVKKLLIQQSLLNQYRHCGKDPIMSTTNTFITISCWKAEHALFVSPNPLSQHCKFFWQTGNRQRIQLYLSARRTRKLW